MPLKKILFTLGFSLILTVPAFSEGAYTTGATANTTASLKKPVAKSKKRITKHDVQKRQAWLKAHPQEAQKIKERRERWRKEHPEESERMKKNLKKHKDYTKQLKTSQVSTANVKQ